MEVAAERRKEVEVLRKRLAEDEVALKERRSEGLCCVYVCARKRERE